MDIACPSKVEHHVLAGETENAHRLAHALDHRFVPRREDAPALELPTALLRDVLHVAFEEPGLVDVLARKTNRDLDTRSAHRLELGGEGDVALLSHSPEQERLLRVVRLHA